MGSIKSLIKLLICSFQCSTTASAPHNGKELVTSSVYLTSNTNSQFVNAKSKKFPLKTATDQN